MSERSKQGGRTERIERRKVTFVGAGPGDPDLLTVKGKRLIETADLVVYAGSLVHPDVLRLIKPEAERHDSAKMALEEIARVMIEGVSAGKRVVRLASGDPSVFGTISEQMDELDAAGVPYEIVPGVSSAFAAAAALGAEYTLPELSQTVILTRLEGRTPMPPKENLASLASHGATIVLFLSTQYIREAVAELLKGYPKETPVAVVQKASWPDQKIVRGTLEDIAQKVKEAGIVWTALVIVGDALDRKGKGKGKRSKLYDKDFSHGFRDGEKNVNR
ncbi:MAG TPA: precorrin-4 C(11)-methyltransferase [Candidatus Manganitrophaceae bacterium]|nr:precorrin-4 C(11)-methyltransferase [Candidatus Manganitrophaceae bacterium]